jgi:hypothetical protein
MAGAAVMSHPGQATSSTRCGECGKSRRPRGGDLASVAASAGTGLQQAFSGLLQPYRQMARMMTSTAAGPRHHHDDDCGCAPDSCHCSCCIGDADLVVYARLGEQRVVPITIENSRRRERSIDLELSEWATHGGRSVDLQAAVDPAEPFELGPCQERAVMLLLDLPSRGQGEGEGPSDVDDCTVAYADLRVKGCDMRPIRIAVALLPRDCATYVVDCHCGCC